MTRDEESTQDTEAICDDCNGPNVTWFAPNDLWNRAAREPDGTDPMLCPRCFIIRAKAVGIKGSAWFVVPESTTVNELIAVSGHPPHITAGYRGEGETNDKK